MTKILLIRHGHVAGIKPERFRGREPLNLTSRGYAQARAVAQRIAGAWRPSRIYTSPMGRAVETGAAIVEACQIAAEVSADLNDLDYGAWQFVSYDSAREQNPALFDAWFATPHLIRFPNGESLQDLVARAANALRLVLAHHPDETIVLVAHDSINRAMLLQCLDQPLSAYWRVAQEPCCINEIDIVDGTIRVLRVNDTSHLAAVAADEP